MKPRNPSFRRAARSSNLLGLCTITFTLLAAGQSIAQLTWTGAAVASDPPVTGELVAWSNSANWLDTATLLAPGVPVNGTVLNFGGATYGAPVNLPTNQDLSELTTGTINLTSNGTAGQTAAFTLGTAGQSITLGGNISTTAIASGGTNLVDTINLNLILNANRTITTNQNHGMIINGIISQIDATPRNLTKGGGGSGAPLTLTGNNTYTGNTIIETGTLNVTKIADTGSGLDSNMGYGTKFLLGNNNTSATLNYTGSGDTTARTLDISSSTGNNSGGATINQNGTNGGSGLVFSATNFTNTVSTTAGERTLTLGGSNTDANQISGIIANMDEDRILKLTKSGAGRWILAGANTYTGISTISAGTLQVNRSTNGLGDSTAVNAISLNNTSTLSLRNDGAGNDGTIIYGSTSNASGYNVQVISGNNSSMTINVDNLTANTGNTIQLGPLTQATAGNRTLNVTGGNGYSLKLASLALNPSLGNNTTLNPTTASLIIGDVTNPMSGFLDVVGNNFDTLTLGGTSAGNRIDGVISNAVGGVLNEGDTRITKNGASTWTLNGANTYTGNTTVNDGTLVLADNAQLKFVLGAASGSSNSLTGAGTVTLDGDFVIDTTAADVVLSSGTWILENVTTLTNGDYGDNFQVFQTDGTTPWTDAGSDQWTKTSGAKTYTFDETTGTLTLTSVADPYLAWAGTGVNGFDADANGDGVKNGLAWLLGAANKEDSALNKLPIVTQSGGGLVMTFDMLPASARGSAKLLLEYSADLATWSTGVLVPDAAGGTAPVTFTVSGTNPLDVEATVSSSAALAGKLFGRLKAEK